MKEFKTKNHFFTIIFGLICVIIGFAICLIIINFRPSIITEYFPNLIVPNISIIHESNLIAKKSDTKFNSTLRNHITNDDKFNYINNKNINGTGINDFEITEHPNNNNYNESTKSPDTYVNIDTKYGKIRGLKIVENGIPVNQFLGIPFALPPVKKRRFKRSQLWGKQWNWIRNAIQWPNLCFQNLEIIRKNIKIISVNNYNVSEDCLYLNIWTPEINQNFQNDTLLPVIVFIHGGNFAFTGISLDWYNGKTLSANGNIIVVTIQYRLGVFGFLDADHDDAPGNVGIYDQIIALKWINDNIHYFGGDSNSITLYGQSAGAMSIGLIMSLPEYSHLFQRVILSSGSPMVVKNVYSNGLKKYENFIKKHLCDNPEPKIAIKCLRKIPAEQLIDVNAARTVANEISFIPSIPSDLIPEFPDEFFNNDDGSVIKKDILMGVNAGEGMAFVYAIFNNSDLIPNITTLEDARNVLINIVKDFNISETQIQTLATVAFPELRSSDSFNITKQIGDVFGDFTITCPCLKFVDILSNANIGVNLYYFTQIPSYSRYPKWIGMTHHDELPFVFGLPLRNPNEYSNEDIELSTRIIKIWTHFAKTGKMLPQMGIEWPKTSENKFLHMELNSEYAKIGEYLNADCFLFDMAFDSIR